MLKFFWETPTKGSFKNFQIVHAGTAATVIRDPSREINWQLQEGMDFNILPPLIMTHVNTQ